MGWHSPWEHRAGCPSRAQSHMPDVGWSAGAPSVPQVWLQYHFVALWHSRIGKSIKDFTRQLSNFISDNDWDKRAFWRFLVQLPVQAQSPRSRLLRTTNRWLLAISKNGYSIVSLGNLFQCSLPLTVKKLFLYAQKSVLTNSINITILPNKKFLKRNTGNFDEKQKNWTFF